jgi:hypothetical protein
MSTICDEAQIINADFCQVGFGQRSVRMKHRSIKGDSGFCTTAYSYNMTNDMKDYSAQRISLAMRLLKGLGNEEIVKMIAQREAGL